MILTKKSRFKILLMGICYFALGSIVIGVSIVSFFFGIENNLHYFGIILYVLDIFFMLWGRYAEGKGKHINIGNKLVRKELRPAEFLEYYENLINSPDLVINEPSIEILHLVSVAYILLDDNERALQIIDEMLLIANEKKKPLVKLLKTSHLFDMGRNEEAEALFSEVRSTKMDFTCQALSDEILKSDRAKALGDYKTVELHYTAKLEKSIPPLDNAGRLIINYTLGEIYEKMNSTEKALQHYKYCFDNGGETAVKNAARDAIKRLSNN